MKHIFKLLVLLPLFAAVACDDLLEPAIENNRDIDAMENDPSYALGVLGNAYILLPYNTSPTSDVATDDAVSNDNSNTWRAMATGAWTSQNDPTSQWKSCFNAIQYINLFLEHLDNVTFALDENIQTMFIDHYRGEALGLRAIFMYYLLRAHGGISPDGVLLGVPIKLASEGIGSDFSQPRNTYAECMEQLLQDCDDAIELLALDYKVHTADEIPSKYASMGVTVSHYDRVNGVFMAGRLSGRIMEAVRAQATLMAASPAFSDGSGITWEEAANSAGKLLSRIDGPAGLDADGFTWYTNTSEIAGLGSGEVPPEILWRTSYSDSNTLEGDNFPPSLYGNGRVNPTQNLVDAFPMANGYPIDNRIRMRTETRAWPLTSLPMEVQREAQPSLPGRMEQTTMQSTGNRDTLLVPVTTCANIYASIVTWIRTTTPYSVIIQPVSAIRKSSWIMRRLPTKLGDRKDKAHLDLVLTM